MLESPNKCYGCGKESDDLEFTPYPSELDFDPNAESHWYCGDCLWDSHDYI
jgi:hypothetical protein